MMTNELSIKMPWGDVVIRDLRNVNILAGFRSKRFKSLVDNLRMIFERGNSTRLCGDGIKSHFDKLANLDYNLALRLNFLFSLPYDQLVIDGLDGFDYTTNVVLGETIARASILSGKRIFVVTHSKELADAFCGSGDARQLRGFTVTKQGFVYGIEWTKFQKLLELIDVDLRCRREV